LAKAGAPRGVELILQSVVAALQSIAFAFDIAARPLGAREFLAQPRDLVDQLIAGQTVDRGALARHANVMPVPSHLYKYGILDSQRPPSPHPLNKDHPGSTDRHPTALGIVLVLGISDKPNGLSGSRRRPVD